MRKPDILHPPHYNNLKEMETNVAISLIVCLSEVSVNLFGYVEVILFCNLVFMYGKRFLPFFWCIQHG